MINGKKVLAFIPARSGSKGIPNKNIKPLAGVPLIGHTIQAARNCTYVDEVVVSTDSAEYAEVARELGASVPFLRPAELAADTSKTIDAVLHALDFYRAQGTTFDIFALLQPTSPLRTAADLGASLEYFEAHGEQGLVSVSLCENSPILMRTLGDDGQLTPYLSGSSTVRRQDMPTYYTVNGAIYLNRVEEICTTTSFNDNPIGFVIEPNHAVDIDEPLDFVIAESIMLQQQTAKE